MKHVINNFWAQKSCFLKECKCLFPTCYLCDICLVHLQRHRSSCYFSSALTATIYTDTLLACLHNTGRPAFFLSLELNFSCLGHQDVPTCWPLLSALSPRSGIAPLLFWQTVTATSPALPFSHFKISVSSRSPLLREFDLYQSLWHVTGTRWWLHRGPPWFPPVQQMTVITLRIPPRHTSCCCL